MAKGASKLKRHRECGTAAQPALENCAERAEPRVCFAPSPLPTRQPLRSAMSGRKKPATAAAPRVPAAGAASPTSPRPRDRAAGAKAAAMPSPSAGPGSPRGCRQPAASLPQTAARRAGSAAARLPPTGLLTAPLGLPRVPMGLPFCSSLATFPGGGALTSGLPLPLSGLSRRQGLSLLRSMLGDAAPAGRSQ